MTDPRSSTAASSPLDGAVADLVERGLLVAGTASDLVVPNGSAVAQVENDVRPAPVLTPSGALVADQLIRTVRSQLEKLVGGWSPEQFPELVQLLDEFACDIVPGTPTLIGTGSATVEQ